MTRQQTTGIGMTMGTRTSRHRRRALSYVFFMGPIMLVAVIGLSALMVTRIQMKSAERARDSAAARLYAQSGIELGLLRIRQNVNWRQGTPTWATNVPIGDGSYSLKIAAAPNIVPQGDATDPVVMLSSGVCGEATRIIEVWIGPRGFMSGTWKRDTK